MKSNGTVAEQPAADALGDDLLERLTKLEEMAHNQHSIAPEVIDSIIEQATKRAVQQVVTHLRKALDVLETLEK
jgi:hypothetical protein